jgi:hypothetical protein
MKLLLTTIFSCCLYWTGLAQNATAPADTTIYDVAESLPFPLIKSCMTNKSDDWTVDSVRRCGEAQLLGLLSSNIQYPNEAREKDIQGTVVLSFVVEPSNGRISHIKLLKDIGGGCGEEAIRVLKALDDYGLRWASAIRDSMPVRLRHTIPLRFKLQEVLPYYLTESGDSIYTTYEAEPSFKAGIDSLITMVFNRLQYPKNMADSCKTGVVEMALLVRDNGAVSVENLLDFNNLGLDFQWEAMRLANKTSGAWNPATYNGRPVNATIPLRVVFKSDKAVCKSANETFDKAMLLADEGSTLLGAEKPEEAIQKWTQALALQPNNSELLYYRGTALLNQNKREDACKDFGRIKELLGITWFEELRRLVCGW